MVAARGTGTMRMAPQRSTMQRCLISTKLVLRRFSSFREMLRMMETLLATVRRMTRMMRMHWRGWDRRWRPPLSAMAESSSEVPG